MCIRDRGCAQAYAKLAYCYDYGHYVSQDPAQACHWWTQMANTGDGPACYFVAEYLSLIHISLVR